ncbi:helix-turn-helix domain-containing protein [Haloechinothrix halophila]|uniref:helix-turn-helix domain-containing protein n=1 Tax=Haloechinothrix halophila TaxID=1069073 RepID=UPI00146FAF7D
MTTQEVAQQWGVTDRVVRRMCASGRIPGAFRLGRDWFIPRTSIEKIPTRRDRACQTS